MNLYGPKDVTDMVELPLANALTGQQSRFGRRGYFVADRVDHVQGSNAVFNLALGMKDSWVK